MDKAAVEQLFVEVEPSQEGTEAEATIPTGQHSTEPDADPDTVIGQDINATPTLTADRLGAGADEPLPEPSQVMKEHLQRRADAEAHFKQGETVRSRGKRSQSRSPKNRQARPCHQEQEQQQQQASQQLEMSRQEHTNLEQEIDQMIERTLEEHQVAAHHMDGLRNYLRAETQRDQRVNQLVRYQHEERLRMQQEFDRQQKLLVQEICAEMDLSVYSDASSRAHSD